MTVTSRGEQVRHEHADLMRQHHGYTPAGGAICPRRVAGKHCTVSLTAPCLCQAHHDVLDHANLWRDKDGRLVLTAEPYGADVVDLAALLADLEPLGLGARVAAGSQWYPGWTVLLVIAPSTP